MRPDKDDDSTPSGGRDEFEVAYYTKELGRPLQRQLLRQRLADFMGNRSPRAPHGEDPSPEGTPLPPQDDRAA